MQLIPAIDIRHGRCVRLLKGDFEQVTEYAHDPRELARAYRDQGAEWLHIVDLDGARSGKPANGTLIAEIAAASRLKIQVGGGIRTRSDFDTVLGYADRAVIGSLSVSEPARVATWMADAGPERIVLGLDVRPGADGEPRITTHGWTRTSELGLDAAIDRYRAVGLRHVLCTDVDRDGALTGPNLELYARCVTAWPEIELQASGGVRSAADLQQLAGIGVSGVISGKALLENLISPEELRPFLPNA